MKHTWAITFILFATIVSTANSDVFEEKKYIKLTAAGLFYKQATGSVAFLPTVGDERYLNKVRTYYLLPESGLYRLRKKGNYFFRINHHGSPEELSYVGVVAYLIYPGEYSHRNPLNLTRNDADWRPGEEGRSLDKASKGPDSPDISLHDFFQAHSKTIKNCKDADRILTYTWHAAVKTGDPYTWKYRSKWEHATPPMLDEFLEKLSISKTNYRAAITAHLLQFTISKHPTKPLDFWFNTDGAAGAYLHIFSPIGPSFEKHYYFVFDR